ncbi:MAG: tRNA (N6-isopentenyl adenosine(37)-C2)-methylthiotransferase MiaB [Clostridia bacterium]|nr:tRNA (N6-isopentenyl adenosine(37)-C2)-methylthiotransferase MiaB [Clostridia bacterium]
MNVHDGEIVAGLLTRMGYRPAPDVAAADVVFINTCAVRHTAEEHALGEVGRLKALKRERPDLLLVVGGCITQMPETVERIRRQAPFVDLVVGTHNLHALPELLYRARFAEAMVVDVWKESDLVVEDLPVRRNPGVRAWVTVTYGCDKFCTFCIVPHTRGRERSRQPEDVLAEVAELIEAGYREINLLGQNVNSYGKDLGRGYGLADLLADVDRLPGVPWVRFMTSHPRDFDERLVDVVAGARSVCEHIHLPVQAGSDRVLKRMNRKYTRRQYLDLVRLIRERVPGASLTTDIIVGFPGETEADFRDTLALVQEVEYDNAFTFLYSPRAGTPAARWPDAVPDEVKKERLNRLMEVQYAISRRKNETLVGRELEVLVEGPSKKNPDVYSARTRTNKIVLLPRCPGYEGRFARARVTAAQTFTLGGELCAPEHEGRGGAGGWAGAA